MGADVQPLVCCLACHFRWEERVLFPSLPEHAANQLQVEHNMLSKPGVADWQVSEHAKKELRWFRVYCAPADVAQCERDHEHLGKEAKRSCGGGCSQRRY
jgi:hypothetical protein